ncbi:hypothetical protein BD309DRAFT_929998 [Dichomitus squalens]|uniref:RNI-like protein n=1 Tax=Dichomitus squalens TaxID=114155 RepID=A0A4Q9PZT0_9APHY|nr:hypothetical protein BD311DRAFT_734362 [Dichomitus squalens]TBU38840.1 hypothetical protein BD309DRAFT_929998 [Dichomitus squalens]TBU60189.1 hypothetical protein BD310DRAFT_923512 [Dichomitus squalens]
MNVFALGGFDTCAMPVRWSAAPKVSLASRSHIESMDAGLSSVSGAQEVIKQILARRSVTKLILGHNELGDSGCEELFGFLNSDAGRNHRITHISLNSNGIGNRGLLAISRYLRDNTSLKELFLQNNKFTGNPDVAVVFALAVNASHLETLSLTTNPLLTDTFAAHFLPLLDAPYLHEIHLSVAGLTRASAPHIVEYITSPRCQLHTLKANGNNFRIRAVRSMIRAASRANYTLLRLELYATGMSEPSNSDASSSENEEGAKGSITSWKDSENELKHILTRNATLKHQVEKEALALLRYSRPLLLRPKGRGPQSKLPVTTPCSDSCACVQSSADRLFSSIGQPLSLVPSATTGSEAVAFPFLKLPTELQLYTLSFLAPILSVAQRIRIFTYASDPSTLPALLPCLSTGGGCIPDPASLQFNMGSPKPSSGPLGIGPGGGVFLRKRVGESVSGCANGKCMGAGNSVVCRREAERAQWLASVRCNAFELEGEEHPSEERHD